MPDINLLRDKKSISERSEKKKAGSDIEFTAPSKEKDEVKKRIGGGGVMEFFRSLFSKKEKTDSTKEMQKKKIIRESTERKRKKIVPPPSFPAVNTFEKEKKPSMLDRLFHPPVRTNIIKEEEKETEIPKRQSAEELISRGTAVKKVESSEKYEAPQTTPTPLERKENLGGKTVPREERMETLDVNLIPDEILAGLQPKRKLRQLGLTIGIVVILVGLSYGYMLYRQSNIQGKIEETIEKISSVEQKIAKYNDLKENISSLKKKIDSINQILDNHIYWSQFLTYLERYTLPDVYYTNLAGSTNGKVTLTARAIDPKTLADQYIVFQNAEDFIDSVVIESAVSEKKEGAEEVVNFSISLTIKPEIFYKNDNSQ
ncbi:MAG: hypothetical protein COT24_05710 [Candidatus Kerfeldbacteria bacterium CG08_land_8_20_14_0_20_40_16]|uniref:Fimbrial assembly protein n=1 Tax=Candidatus Kerfeldbacteria bacterium CG08_land_8_20_14_0_20_40_16 TaxID=2014244 RepID=A0A2H0YU48_9BACT|nr:MAG: hypothetical protein COT24_05710 [Candidatus Kerfeldbacteria bacterium CG08_land_8_20_14_0_20_40_16]